MSTVSSALPRANVEGVDAPLFVIRVVGRLLRFRVVARIRRVAGDVFGQSACVCCGQFVEQESSA
jgi:hypothetical protein